MKKIFSLIGIFLIMLTLSACTDNSNLYLKEPLISTQTILSGADEFGNISCFGNGIMYIKNKVMMIYDVEIDKHYPLCSKPNCLHSTTDCSATIDNHTIAKGLTYYGNKVYAFFENFEKNNIELIQMNLDGTEKKIIFNIDKGNVRPNTWQIESIGNEIYYSNGLVWFIINWTYVVDENITEGGYHQLACIQLDNAEMNMLTDRSDGNTNYAYSYFAKNHVIICKRETDEAPLSEYEFYNQYAEGKQNDLPGDESLDIYYRYLLKFNKQQPERYEYLSYSINDSKTISIENGNSIPLYDDTDDKDPVILGYSDPYIFCGEYDGDVLICKFSNTKNENNENEFYLWKLDDNSKTEFAQIYMHGFYSPNNVGHLSIGISNDAKMLYSIYKENGIMDLYQLNLETLESVYLFEDWQYLSWRTQYETNEYFLCQKGDPDISGEESETLYKIRKEDYFNGNFKTVEKIKL